MNTTGKRSHVFAAAFIAASLFTACAHTSEPQATARATGVDTRDDKILRELGKMEGRLDGLESKIGKVQAPPPPSAAPVAPAKAEETPPEVVLPIAPPQPELKPEVVKQNAITATALLFAQDESGNLRMLCTATAFDRKGKIYKFVSAAHCVSEDDTVHERAAVAPLTYFITFDDPDKKNFFEAKVVAAGYMHRGDDFSVLEVQLDIDVPTVPLAAADPQLDEDVINVASPLGLGKQLFRGHVSMSMLKRPVIAEDINWKGAVLLQISVGPGSSGSAAVSKYQKGICAFIVGMIGRGSPIVVAIPVSKFKKFWTEVQQGKYKYYKPGTDIGSSAMSKARIERLIQRAQNGVVYRIATDDDLKQLGAKSDE